MPIEVKHSPPPLHRPGDVTARPKSILKNPSFSGPSGPISSPHEETASFSPAVAAFNDQEAQDLTVQNTIQNAGHRRSSSAARRPSSGRRLSSTAAAHAANGGEEDQDGMRLKWDEANLYLAEQESGGRMKITEPKTPYQYGEPMEEDEDEDVAIDPRFVNVDEVDMANNKGQRKKRESEIPGLDIGEPEDETTVQPGENERIFRAGSSASRENSKDKHVSVSEGGGQVGGFATLEEQEKHEKFEQMRKKHYEMRDVKDLLGHPQELDAMDEDEEGAGQSPKSTKLPSRGANANGLGV